MSVLFGNNALSTLAGSIASTDTTCTLSPGTGALFPNPTGGNYFMLTFANAANTLWEIVMVTARSGDTCTIVRGQEGTAAQSWAAGSPANGLITAGALATFLQQSNSRIRLVAATTFYISTSGSDVTGNGTFANPWATLQNAFSTFQEQYDFAGNAVTVQFADGSGGTYNDTAVVNAAIPGQISPIILAGNSVTPDNVVYGAEISVSNGGWIHVQNMKGQGATFLDVGIGGIIEVGTGVDFGACSGSHMQIGGGGIINLLGNYKISGSAPSHFGGISSGSYGTNGVTATLSAGLTFSAAFMNLTVGCSFFGPITFAGSSATGKKFSLTQNCAAATAGSVMPGSVAGTTDSTSSYT